MNAIKKAVTKELNNSKNYPLFKKILIPYIKKAIPRIITFTILFLIYSYIWSKYGYERMLLTVLIVIIILLGNKK